MKRIRDHARRFLDFSRKSQIALILFVEILFGSVIVLSALGIFFRLAREVAEKEVISFDSWVTQLIYLTRTPPITSFMNFITFLGGEYFLDTAIVLSILFLLRKHKLDSIIFAFMLFLSVSLNFYLKEFFHRARPDFLPLAIEKTYSFPSGHAMNSFVFYTCVSYFIFRNMKNRKLGVIFTVLSGVLILLIGISRIYLGVHYPSDVLAGYAAGLLCFVAVLLFEKTILLLRLYRRFEQEKKY